MVNLAELSRLAEALNQQTDLYTQSLTELEKKLVRMNLGIETWVTLMEVATSGTPNRDTCIRTLLGFAKTSEGWGFATKEYRIERGYFQGDEDCPYENHYEESPAKLLLKSSREVRIRAAGRIEELLDALKDRAEQTIPKLREASDLARQV